MDFKEKILDYLPHSHPFRFVDEITEVDDHSISGTYTFKEDEFFYQGHFKDYPVTPGVILTECMAQIALGCHSIYLLRELEDRNTPINHSQFFTDSEVQFLKAVYPGEKVFVSSQKVYFRHGKIKSRVIMTDADGEQIAKANLAAIINIHNQE